MKKKHFSVCIRMGLQPMPVPKNDKQMRNLPQELANAIEQLGYPVFADSRKPKPWDGNAPLFWTTPSGVTTAETLYAAGQVVPDPYTTLAAVLLRKPEVLAEFSAAARLDADKETLRAILQQLRG